jgi:hypothetical protein
MRVTQLPISGPSGRQRLRQNGRASLTAARTRTRTIVFAFAVAALLGSQAGVASAATRGFKVKNDSKVDLRVISADAVPTVLCGGPDAESFQCIPAAFPYSLEARPPDGAVLRPGGEHDWEMSYWYNPGDLFGAEYHYAAKLNYQIGNGTGKFEATIKDSNYSNDSECKVIPKSLGTCTAEGRSIAFK